MDNPFNNFRKVGASSAKKFLVMLPKYRRCQALETIVTYELPMAQTIMDESDYHAP